LSQSCGALWWCKLCTTLFLWFKVSSVNKLKGCSFLNWNFYLLEEHFKTLFSPAFPFLPCKVNNNLIKDVFWCGNILGNCCREINIEAFFCVCTFRAPGKITRAIFYRFFFSLAFQILFACEAALSLHFPLKLPVPPRQNICLRRVYE